MVVPMQFPKPQRTKNRELLDWIKEMRCVACGLSGPSDPAHIRSRGAGGGDTFDNVIPLCRPCHSLQHNSGWAYFSERYPQIQFELLVRGRADLLQGK
jgi:5-methylcytosine-specific restriction endonuclease McrA